MLKECDDLLQNESAWKEQTDPRLQAQVTPMLGNICVAVGWDLTELNVNYAGWLENPRNGGTRPGKGTWLGAAAPLPAREQQAVQGSGGRLKVCAHPGTSWHRGPAIPSQVPRTSGSEEPQLLRLNL